MKAIVTLLTEKLKFPRIHNYGQLFHEFTLDRSSLGTSFSGDRLFYEHHWDVLFDPWYHLIHKVHAYGVTDNANRGFPRNKACLYGEYADGCTWIFDADGDITTLSFDREHGYGTDAWGS